MTYRGDTVLEDVWSEHARYRLGIPFGCKVVLEVSGQNNAVQFPHSRDINVDFPPDSYITPAPYSDPSGKSLAAHVYKYRHGNVLGCGLCDAQQ